MTAEPRSRRLRLGEPVELPWWAPLALLPPLAAGLLGIVLPAPLGARAVDVVASALMAWAVVAVSTRVASRSMQSVWLSAAYAFWFFAVLGWAVALHG